jgi:hypothetical protein
VSIRGRGWVGIDDRQEVIAFAIRIAGPGKQIVACPCGFLILRMHEDAADGLHESQCEEEARHEIS